MTSARNMRGVHIVFAAIMFSVGAVWPHALWGQESGNGDLYDAVTITKEGHPERRSLDGLSAQQTEDLRLAKAALTEFLRRLMTVSGKHAVDLLTEDLRKEFKDDAQLFQRYFSSESAVLEYQITGFAVDHGNGIVEFPIVLKIADEGAVSTSQRYVMLRRDDTQAWRIAEFR